MKVDSCSNQETINTISLHYESTCLSSRDHVVALNFLRKTTQHKQIYRFIPLFRSLHTMSVTSPKQMLRTFTNIFTYKNKKDWLSFFSYIKRMDGEKYIHDKKIKKKK